MASTIKLKNGSGAPTAGDLVQGEPALDLTNKRLYTEDSGGTVLEIGTNPTSVTTGTFTSTGIDDNATSTAITIDSSQNVGIGTSSPTSLGANVTTLEIKGGQTDRSGGFYLKTSDDSQSAYGYMASGLFNLGTGSSTPLSFITGGSERARIDSSGNLLVGKTASGIANSGVELTPNDRSAFTRSNGSPILANRTTSDGAIIDFRKDGTTVGTIGTEGGDLTIGTGDVGLKFNDGASLISPWDITANAPEDGLFDLGYANGRFKDLYLSGGVYLGGTNASKINSNVDGTIIYDADPSNTKAYTAHIWKLNGSESARIDSSGNLLVGRTSVGSTGNGHSIRGGDSAIFSRDAAGESMSVCRNASAGDIVRFYCNGVDKGSINFDGSNTISYTSSSDQRLKENIADADDAGSKIDAIQVRQYDWKADGSHQDYGMIAQELQAVAPEAVSGDPGSEEMMGVDYSKLVPMLIKEIQSLRNRVAQLEAEENI